MKVSVNLLESDAQITKAILNSLLSDTKDYMNKVAKRLEPEIKNIVKEGFLRSSEYRSLLSGQLRYEFGLDSPASKVNQILEVWNNTVVTFDAPRIKGNKIYSKLVVAMINSNYSDVLALDASQQRTKKGQSLPWLEWLLLMGDKTIIKDYEIFLGSGRNSRTGGVVMKKVVNGKWKVPSEFSGSSKNNWVTRVLDGVETQIDSAIKKAIKS